MKKSKSRRVMLAALTGLLVLAPVQSAYMPQTVQAGQVSSASDSRLSDFDIAPGTLNPAFSPDVLQYTATVDADVTSVSVRASFVKRYDCVCRRCTVAASRRKYDKSNLFGTRFYYYCIYDYSYCRKCRRYTAAGNRRGRAAAAGRRYRSAAGFRFIRCTTAGRRCDGYTAARNRPVKCTAAGRRLIRCAAAGCREHRRYVF